MTNYRQLGFLAKMLTLSRAVLDIISRRFSVQKRGMLTISTCLLLLDIEILSGQIALPHSVPTSTSRLSRNLVVVIVSKQFPQLLLKIDTRFFERIVGGDLV